jgi:hypothetical protein
MSTFIVFIISLALIVFLFAVKARELSTGRKIFLEELFLKCDDKIYNILNKIKYWWGHVNFKNTRLIFLWIIVSIRKLVVAVKRRFDHEQSHFFTKKEYKVPKNKGAVSFFLKDVSDYKKSLREGMEDKKSKNISE